MITRDRTSLTSYIMRLAKEHCVTPQALVQQEIFPLCNQTNTIQNHSSWLGKFWWAGTPALNGMSLLPLNGFRRCKR